MLSTGWIPEVPTPRHTSLEEPNVRELLTVANFDADVTLPPKFDLRADFPPVFQQGDSMSCTANACAGLLSFYEKHAYGPDAVETMSRLFIYKTARNLMQVTTDSGVYMRLTMEALTVFGAVPETFWPFDPTLVDVEPTPFCYAFASRYRAAQSFRLDQSDTASTDLLTRIKQQIYNALPPVFGFYLFSSIGQAQTSGDIPVPSQGEQWLGGHAVVAVGYDDDHVVPSINPTSGVRTESRGAILIRNSWGAAWGDGGYGWLPYDYVLSGLTSDWWSLLKLDYLNTGNFGPPNTQDEPETQDNQETNSGADDVSTEQAAETPVDTTADNSPVEPPAGGRDALYSPLEKPIVSSPTVADLPQEELAETPVETPTDELTEEPSEEPSAATASSEETGKGDHDAKRPARKAARG